jgi:hypothetical protein
MCRNAPVNRCAADFEQVGYFLRRLALGESLNFSQFLAA